MLAQRLGEQRVEIALGGEAHGRRERAGERRSGLAAVASVSVASTASSSSAARCCSSRMSKPGGTPASSGKRCSSRSQKAWMVCTLRPPGVSMALANSWRARSISSAEGARSSRSASFAFSVRVGRSHPFGEPLEHARRHLGRGGLGVGERQDALGLGAGEQQAQHAHGQHVRLAGAGIGADPGRGRGIGGGGLIAPRLLAHGGKRIAGSRTGPCRVLLAGVDLTIRRRGPDARSRRSRT